MFPQDDGVRGASRRSLIDILFLMLERDGHEPTGLDFDTQAIYRTRAFGEECVTESG